MKCPLVITSNGKLEEIPWFMKDSHWQKPQDDFAKYLNKKLSMDKFVNDLVDELIGAATKMIGEIDETDIS